MAVRAVRYGEDTLTIRTVQPAEFAALAETMDALLRRAYRAASFADQLRWNALVQPDCIVVAERRGVVVGTGCGIAYTEAGFGWIGLVATDPERERQGIGTAVTERIVEILAGHGCAAVLDASVAGGPVYERMGFTDHGLTRVFRFPGSPPAVQRATALTARDLDEIAQLDGEVFGGRRRRLLDLVLGQYPGRGAVVRDAAGALAGFAMAQPSVVGPLVATDAATCADLLAYTLALPWLAPPLLCLPPESSFGELMLDLGGQFVRELRHMRHGLAALPGHTALYAGRLSLGLG